MCRHHIYVLSLKCTIEKQFSIHQSRLFKNSKNTRMNQILVILIWTLRIVMFVCFYHMQNMTYLKKKNTKKTISRKLQGVTGTHDNFLQNNFPSWNTISYSRCFPSCEMDGQCSILPKSIYHSLSIQNITISTKSMHTCIFIISIYVRS